jgi:hypothetical protein
MKKRFLHLGWKSKVMQKRSTFSVSINKIVATGCNLTKGQSLYCYLAEDESKRPIIIVYLDGRKRENGK